MTRRVIRLADLPADERPLVEALLAFTRAIQPIPASGSRPTSTAAGGALRPASKGPAATPRPVR